MHPLLVHFSISLWPLVLVFDLLSRLAVGGNTFVQISFYIVTFGLVVALLAMPIGLFHWCEGEPDKRVWEISLYHMFLNIVAVLLWLVNFDLRVDLASKAASVSLGSLMLSGVGLLLLLVAGYLGGLVLYEHGVNLKHMVKPK